MADTITTLTNLDDAILNLLDKGFLLAGDDNNVVSQFVNRKYSFNANSIDIVKYASMADATTALTEGSDVDAVAVTDSKVNFKPLEYGNVVTKTSLRSLQSGGQIDLGIAGVVGQNMSNTLNALAIQAGEASTNEIFSSDDTEVATVAGDVISGANLAVAYTNLAGANIRKFAGDSYLAVMHPDIAHDLRAGATAGTWTDVSKYSDAMSIMKNEIGFFQGFRIIQSTGVSVNANAGASNVDTYRTLCMGQDAIAQAVSQNPSLRVTGPFDKLGRHMHVGWYGVFDFGILDQDALWAITSASSVGAN